MGRVEKQVVKQISDNLKGIMNRKSALASVPITYIGIFYIFPILAWLWTTFANPESGMTKRAFSFYTNGILRTAYLSGISALLAVVIGSASSLLQRFSSERVGWWVTISMVLPLLTGFIARNYAWLGLLSWLTTGTGIVPTIGNYLVFTRLGEVIVLGSIFIPFCYFIVMQGLRNVNINQMEAAETMGLNKLETFYHVVLKIIYRSVLIAFGVSFVFGAGYFVTPRMIGGGKYNFIGNYINVLLNDIGSAGASALLGSMLLLSLSIPMGLLLFYVSQERKKLSEW